MKLSVFIPLYNGERFLRECLDSVFGQAVAPYEVLVVDDGSTDGGVEIAASYGVRILNKPHGGLADTLNHAFAAVTGDWVGSIDADDIWSPQKMALQREATEKAPGLEVLFTGVEQFDSNGTVSVSHAPHRGSMLIRRNALARIGEFRRDLKVGEFLEWYSRSQAAGLQELRMPDVLYRRRIHDRNMTLIKADQRDYLKVLKLHMDRKRKA